MVGDDGSMHVAPAEKAGSHYAGVNSPRLRARYTGGRGKRAPLRGKIQMPRGTSTELQSVTVGASPHKNAGRLPALRGRYDYSPLFLCVRLFVPVPGASQACFEIYAGFVAQDLSGLLDVGLGVEDVAGARRVVFCFCRAS